MGETVGDSVGKEVGWGVGSADGWGDGAEGTGVGSGDGGSVGAGEGIGMEEVVYESGASHTEAPVSSSTKNAPPSSS